ncbi:hypothetical protein K8B33_04200 [Alcanivorax sp. JB21]|uniref:hypothetical protein n=1 Tax=Alcanivorax limicola TaxID=2874102 RepID=UPI001CBF9415|nr:hypothetical protein [Alcanivorax limicola]MBZ2188283.1 hypothetical protein [Alcanivorax limicola]
MAIHRYAALLWVGLLLSACGGGGSNGTAETDEGEAPWQAGLVLQVGLREDNSLLAEQAADALVGLLAEHSIHAGHRVVRTHCPRGTGLGGTRACFDIWVRIAMSAPFQAYRLATLREVVASEQLAARLADHEALQEITFVDQKGTLAPQYAMLFALRGMSAITEEEWLAMSAMPRMATSSSDEGAELQRVPELIWKNPITTTTKNEGYQQRVLAPGYHEGSGVGTKVLTGLSARVSKGGLTCLRGVFHDLATFNGDSGHFGNVMDVVTSGDCSSTEREVQLDTSQVAVGMNMKVSDNNVKALGLAWGNPTVWIRDDKDHFPDFLLNVDGKKNVAQNGTSSGTWAPDAFYLDESWPYVIVGVEARTTNSKVSGLTLHLGYLSSPAPDKSDFWYGHTIETIEQAATDILNQVYPVLATEMNFELYPDCASTIGHIRFCGNLGAKDSYSENILAGWADVAICETEYGLCMGTVGIFDPGTCKKERNKCYDSMTLNVTGSAEVDIRNVKGLAGTHFAGTEIPYLSSGPSLSIETRAIVEDGLASDAYWRLQQDPGIVVSDTTTIRTDKLKFRIRAKVDGTQCVPGESGALFLTVSAIDVIDLGVWDIDGFIGDVLGVVDDSLAWLGESLDDLFQVPSLQNEYEKLLDDMTDMLTGELNVMLADIPILSCE